MSDLLPQLNDLQQACYEHYCGGPWFAVLRKEIERGHRISGIPVPVTLDRSCAVPDDEFSVYRVEPIISPEPSETTNAFLATNPPGMLITGRVASINSDWIDTHAS